MFPCLNGKWYNAPDDVSGHFFLLSFDIQLFCFVVAINDLVLDVEATRTWPVLTTNSIWKSFFCNMNDARETANCSFTGIAHISEKISTCRVIMSS